MKKKIISFALLTSILISQISFSPIQNLLTSYTEKEYVIIAKTADGHKSATDTLTSYEAKNLKEQEGIVVVEEEGEVKGSSIKNNLFNKEKQEKHLNQISDSSSDNWNKKIINVDSDSSSSVDISDVDSKIKIALIDSGVNYDQNLNIIERKNFIENDENVSYLYEDISGHGTSIAGIIASKESYKKYIIGINPSAEIYSARVLDKNLTAPISRVVAAIYWAIDKNVNIISISFGTTEDSDALKVAIQDAYDAGILIIAATGNNGKVEYPAAYDQVMAVGSINQEGTVSDFSPCSDKLEIVAPGENITSSAAFGGKMMSSGTSLSVPHIVGVASLLWQKDASRPADFIRKLIDYSANLYGDTKLYGNGLIDQDYALKIYNKFSKIYSEDNIETDVSKAEDAGALKNNSSELNYVEGSWTRDGHQFLASKYYPQIGLVWDYYEYLALMYGCIFPDTYISNIGQFHGHLWIGANDSNYIYLTKVAQKISTNSSVTSSTVSIVSGMFSNDYSAMNSVILYNNTTGAGSVNGVTWPTICSNAGVNNTPENRAAFVYGLALHLTTDVVAHCSWRYANGNNTWYKITHSADNDGDGIVDADDTDYIPARYNTAYYLAHNVMNLCIGSWEGIINDFIIPQLYYDAGNATTEGSQDFLLGNFKYYATLIDTNYGNSEIFRYGDLYYQCTKYSNNFVYTYDGITHVSH